MFKKALEKLNVAMEIYQTMMFEDSIGKVRMAAGFIADYLSVAVAFINQTYFKYSQIEQIDEISAMKDIPDNFIQYYKSIIRAGSVDEFKKLCHLMILSTRKFMSSKRPENKTDVCSADFHDLSSWYEELCYTWRRIYFCCDQKDVEKAFVWGCLLQQELNIVKEEFSLKEMDLLGTYDANDLHAFHRRAEELENYIAEQISNHGVELNEFKTIEDFLAANS
jgi:hypothetical protein